MRKALIQRMQNIRYQDGERGAAIVAAIGVMIICISLGVLIVSQAISTQRDSGRNRARTAEIHTAEAGVDILHSKMQNGEFPCSWTMTYLDTDDPEEFSLGPDEVGAEAEIKYWDEDGNSIGCLDSESLLDDEEVPARARILVTSANERGTLAGIEPKRSFESEVLLAQSKFLGEGAAVFSANGIMTTNGATVTTLDRSSGIGDIWVDSGDVDCNSSFTASGNLFIPDGSLKMSGNCEIQGDAWVSGSTSLNQAPTKIGGDLWSKSGPVVMESGTTVGGTVTTESATITCRDCNAPAKRSDTPIDPFHEPRGLPEVTFSPSDWEGFTERNYYEVVRKSAVDNGASSSNDVMKEPVGKQNQCKQLAGAHYSLNGPLRLPEEDSILDARDCDFESLELDVILRADTVIFANSFLLGNGFDLRSEGGEYTLWLIVPDPVRNGVAECTRGIGNISTNTSVTTKPEASIFLYTPCTVDLSNTGVFYGQIYGSPVNLRNENDTIYMPIGIPGVDLLPGYVDARGGWNVDVIYKRETSERVEVN